MRNVIVTLAYLDKVGAVIIGNRLPINFNNNPDKIIGHCTVEKNDKDGCIGMLELDNNVSDDLYFYYTSLNAPDGGYWFSGLSLAEKKYEDRPCTQLKDMIIGR